MVNKVRVTELKGVPHALTQADGNTFRLFARKEVVINEKLLSPEFYAEQKRGEIRITSVKNEKVIEKSEVVEEKKVKGGNK